MSGWTSMFRGFATACAAVALCAPLAACKTPLERAWGVSYHAHTAQTIANPEAGLDDLEAPRPDGMSAGAALSKFRKNEVKVKKSEKQQTVINVNN